MPENENMTVRAYRPVQEALDELERELNVRSRCFPRWVQDGRVSKTDAQDRLDRLATALKLLELLQASTETVTVKEYWTGAHAVLSDEPEIGSTARAKPF